MLLDIMMPDDGRLEPCSSSCRSFRRTSVPAWSWSRRARACATARRRPSSAPTRSSPKPFSVDDLLDVLHELETGQLDRSTRQTVSPASASTPSSGSSSCARDSRPRAPRRRAAGSRGRSRPAASTITAPAAGPRARARPRSTRRPRRRPPRTRSIAAEPLRRMSAMRSMTPPSDSGLARPASPRSYPNPVAMTDVGELASAPTAVRGRRRVRPRRSATPSVRTEGVDRRRRRSARSSTSTPIDTHEARIPAHVARGAVERVDHPSHAGRAGAVRALLAEDRVVGPLRRGCPRRSRARRPGRRR